MTEMTPAIEGAGADPAAPNAGADAAANANANPAASGSAPAADPKAADATLLGGAGATEDKPVAAPADWPTDWREKLAGGDMKELEQLKRSGSPLDVWKKARSLEQKLSSGEYKRELGKDATPEQVAEWRKEQGIPEAPDGYKIELPGGVIPGEADKPVIDAFTKAVHEKGWSNDKVNEALDWYYKEQDRKNAETVQRDGDFKRGSEDKLRGEWGADFRRNLTAAENLIAGMPGEAAKNFLTGRLADGTKIGDNADVLKWLSGISMDLNPAATLVPAGSGGVGVSDRLGEIRQMRRENPDSYDSNKAVQAEELQLIEIELKMKNRGKAA